MEIVTKKVQTVHQINLTQEELEVIYRSVGGMSVQRLIEDYGVADAIARQNWRVYKELEVAFVEGGGEV